MAILFAMPAIGQTVKLEQVMDALPGPVPVDLELLGFTGANGNVGAITLFIEFDNALLTYSGATAISINGGTALINQVGNKLNVNWSNNAGSDFDGLFVELQFQYSGGFATDLTFVGSNEIANNSAGLIAATYENGSISPLADVDGYLYIGTMPNALPGEPASVPVTIVGDVNSAKFAEVTSMSLYVAIESTQLTFLGLSSNTYGFTAGYDNGIITLLWSNSTPVDFSSFATLFDLNFTYEGGGNAPVEFSSGSIVTSGVEILNVIFGNGVIQANPDLPQRAVIGDVFVCEEQYVNVPVSFEAMPHVGSFNFVIEFDPTVVAYNGLVNYHSNIASLAVGLTGGNTLNIAWSNVTGVALNGKLFDIKFEHLYDPEFQYPLPMPDFICDVVFKGGSIVKEANATTVPTSFINGSVTHARQLNLTVFLEGLYYGSGMNKAQDHDGTNPIDAFGGTVADKIKVELRDENTYATLVFSDDDVDLNIDGTATVHIPFEYSGSYWITVKHRNHLETVSAAVVSFVDCAADYNFTSAANKAYGDNQKLLSDGKYGIFAGDVDQDGLVSIQDRGDVIISLLNGEVGYIPEDLDGSGTITIQDRGDVIIALLAGRVSITP